MIYLFNNVVLHCTLWLITHPSNWIWRRCCCHPFWLWFYDWIFPTNSDALTLPLLTFQHPDRILRYHLHPPNVNSKNAVFTRERWGNGSFPFLHWFSDTHYCFQVKSSPQCIGNDIQVPRLNPRCYHQPPRTNINRKQGPGQVRLCFQSIFTLFFSSFQISLLN
jgi:hypothetical protein